MNEQETTLVTRAAAGDGLALTLLLKSGRRDLGAALERRLPPNLRGMIDADDLVQETHVEVFRHIGTFVPRGDDSFERWVRTIALRKPRDAIRRQRTIKRGGGPAPTQVARSEEDSMIMLLDMV